MGVRIGLVSLGAVTLGTLAAGALVATGHVVTAGSVTVDPSAAPSAPGTAHQAPAAPLVPASPAPPPPAPSVRWLTVVPNHGRPGDTVSVDVACTDDPGPVRSPALDIGSLSGDTEGHRPWNRSAGATVLGNPGPGAYPVTALCGETRLSSTFTVLPPAPHPPGGGLVD